MGCRPFTEVFRCVRRIRFHRTDSHAQSDLEGGNLDILHIPAVDHDIDAESATLIIVAAQVRTKLGRQQLFEMGNTAVREREFLAVGKPREGTDKRSGADSGFRILAAYSLTAAWRPRGESSCNAR